MPGQEIYHEECREGPKTQTIVWQLFQLAQTAVPLQIGEAIEGHKVTSLTKS